MLAIESFFMDKSSDNYAGLKNITTANACWDYSFCWEYRNPESV